MTQEDSCPADKTENIGAKQHRYGNIYIFINSTKEILIIHIIITHISLPSTPPAKSGHVVHHVCDQDDLFFFLILQRYERHSAML